MKNKQEAYEKPIEMKRNNDYTTGNYSCLYYQNYYTLIYQDNQSIPQQINFRGKLVEDEVAKMFFIAEKKQKLF